MWAPDSAFEFWNNAGIEVYALFVGLFLLGIAWVIYSRWKDGSDS